MIRYNLESIEHIFDRMGSSFGFYTIVYTKKILDLFNDCQEINLFLRLDVVKGLIDILK